MGMVQIATNADVKNFYELWQICFGDSDAFCDWFFTNRFTPEYSVYMKVNDCFVACMQAFPYTIRIRNKLISGAMMCGVCTHPNHRKKGYMGQIFSYDMQVLRQKNIAVAVHTPAVLQSYFHFGHCTVADACYLTSNCIPDCPITSEQIQFYTEYLQKAVYQCYQKYAKQYSGIIERTEKDFVRKLSDYFADGGNCVVYYDTQVQAYACYYQTEQEIICVEAMGEESALKEVLCFIASQGVGCKFSAKLPPQTHISLPFTKKEIKPKGVMGLVNIQLLLQQLSLYSESAFLLKDDIVKENNGCFTLDGKQSKQKPAFCITSGILLPILVGYTTLEEQKQYIEIYDIDGFWELHQKLPKVDCYIIDEY